MSTLQTMRNDFLKVVEKIKTDYINGAKTNRLECVENALTALKSQTVTIGIAAARTLTEDILNTLDPDQGFGALHWSIKHHNVAMTKAIIDAGADASLRARNSQTPLDMMITRTKGGNVYGSSQQAEILVNEGGATVHSGMSDAAERAGASRATVDFLKKAGIPNPDTHTRDYNQMDAALQELAKFGYTLD